MLKKSKTEIEYLRFYKKLIVLLEKQRKVKLKIIATELGIPESDLLEKLCYYSKFQSYELDGDTLILLPNRNIAPEFELAMYEKMIEPLNKELNEKVSPEVLKLVQDQIFNPLHIQINENVKEPVENNIISKFHNEVEINLQNWDLAIFKARINELIQFTRRIRYNFLNDYFKSKYNEIPDVLELLNQEFGNLFSYDGEFIIFNI